MFDDDAAARAGAFRQVLVNTFVANVTGSVGAPCAR